MAPESPRLLLAQGRIEEAKRAINLIARLNMSAPIDWDSVDLSSLKKCEGVVQRLAPLGPPLGLMVFTIEISNVSPQTDLPSFRRMLSNRMSSRLDETQVVEASSSSPLSFYSSQRSFRVSFGSKSEA